MNPAADQRKHQRLRQIAEQRAGDELDGADAGNARNQIGQQVGELVNRNLEAGSYNYTWNAGNQSSGIYFYELQANEFKSVRKMTLIK